MEKTHQNQVALITGSSRGIGRAIAFQLAERGAHIALNYVLNQEAAEKTARELTKKGAKVHLFQANVGDLPQCRKLVEDTIQIFGGLDILIHNAALGAFKPVHKLRMNQWDLSMEINTKAFLVLVQSALPYFEKKKKGCILAVSSLGSQRYIPHYGAIGISKAALETLVRYLAVELAPKNIRVNCVSGGLVNTDALKSFPYYEKLKAEVIQRTPAGRIAEPEDLARAAVFLTSPEASWIIGQTLIADGGLSLV